MTCIRCHTHFSFKEGKIMKIGENHPLSSEEDKILI